MYKYIRFFRDAMQCKKWTIALKQLCVSSCILNISQQKCDYKY